MALLLFKQGDGFKLGVWHIEEDYSFFAAQISYQPVASHPGKQSQQLATRYLLKELQPDFPLEAIQINREGKPYLSNLQMNFNLSHTNHFAAAIISDVYGVGIDTEKIDDRVLKIQRKFLHKEELLYIDPIVGFEKVEILTKYWTIKEAVYKWWGIGGVDFSNDIKIDSTNLNEEYINVEFNKDGGIQLSVHCIRLKDHWISFVVK